jgi:hypothetical protein
MPEDQIQIDFIKWCETENIKVAMIFQELGVFKTTKGFHAIVNRLLHLGLRKGVPDVMLIHNNQIIFIEFKTDTGQLSPHQKKWQEAINTSPAKYFVCRSTEEAIDKVKNL